MNPEIPDHIREQLHRLITDGLPAEEIAIMLRLDVDIVLAEIERVTTTDPSKKATDKP